ncbi:MHS family MFS transporter [Pseudomonas sp. JQ170]|uniref:MFS transporter n=1 Tax=unclassified Pseudomonas TaxID=196821 RepID=UPI00264B2CE9|nr:MULTISPECIES: MFS transporter [unclassified Pseudomonas]MDN7142352.1 MHS family MFS transporter [Pseudomonas sp. JQ170]WRO74083.1 MFS transporter [Pseudomonas sp. 170C]
MAKHAEGLHATQQTKKATASGWVGSALEYYDFFIYAQAAALIFPQIFFPSSDPSVAIIASLATYGVGYLARPVGAFFLGHWGDTRGRKNVLLLCMFLMGLATVAVGLLPTYNQIGYWAPALLVVLRLIQGFAVAGEIAGASSMILEHAPPGRRGFFASFTLQGVQAGQVLAAAIFLPLAYFMPEDAFNSWGWRIPFLLSAAVLIAAFIIRREVEEPQAFTRKVNPQVRQRSPIRDAFKYSWRGMLVVLGVSLMNVIPVVTTVFGAAYAVQPAYGVGFDKSVYLWIPVVGNIVAVLVIPFVGNLSDRIGRRPLIIGSALGCGLMSFLYLYAISLHNLPLAFAASLLMWGMIYQGYNAIFPSFFPEQFQTHYRVSAMAIAQNVGYMFTALLPALFTAVAPPGSDNVPLLIGSITCVVTAISAIAAWSAPETYRTPLDQLGRVDAVALDKPTYDALRTTSLTGNLHP